jgi:RHS repeat-associated protein
MTSVTDARQNTTHYTYCGCGGIATIENALGQFTTFIRDPLDQIVYSARGLTSYTGPDAKTTTYVYDAAARKTSETTPKSETISDTYNAAGDLLTLTDGRGKVTTWTYDNAGRVKTKQYHGQSFANLRYDYDAEGRLAWRRFYSSGSVYKQTGYTFDPVGNLTFIDYPNSPDVTFQYDALNRLESMIDAVGTTGFQYTPGGNLWKEILPWASHAITHTYHPSVPRLRTGLTVQQPTGNWSQSFGYDAGWNMATHTVNGSPTTYTINDRNQVTGIGASETAGFDANGNLTWRYNSAGPNGLTYIYDDENRLIEMRTDTDYTPLDYRWKTEWIYDGLGRVRVRKEYIWYDAYQWYPNGETRYIYDGMRVIQERNSGNTPTVAYTRGNDLSGSLEGAGGIGGLLARSHGYSGGNWNTHSFYHADGGGNVTMLLNSLQAGVAQYRYDPFGRTLSQTGDLAAANLYRFSSKELHAKSGMYYYGFRFYEPHLQRWINRDPIGELGGINLYGFVANDPPNLVDGDGRLLAVIVIGSAVVFGWATWEVADGIKNMKRKADIAAHNRPAQFESASDPRTSYAPPRDAALERGLQGITPELYTVATGPGTLAGGPAGIAENAADAAIGIIWEIVQPQPDLLPQ